MFIKNKFRNPLFIGDRKYIPSGEVGECDDERAENYIDIGYADEVDPDNLEDDSELLED